MLPDIQPGNTKILYFFNCLLDGMHTTIPYICDFSRGGLNTRLYMLVSKPCSEATNIGDRLSLRAVYWMQEQNQTPLLHSPHFTQKKLKTILCPVLILADTGDLIKREHIR